MAVLLELTTMLQKLTTITAIPRHSTKLIKCFLHLVIVNGTGMCDGRHEPLRSLNSQRGAGNAPRDGDWSGGRRGHNSSRRDTSNAPR